MGTKLKSGYPSCHAARRQSKKRVVVTPAFLMQCTMKMDQMKGSDEPVMKWVVFTTLYKFSKSRAEQLSYQAEMHLVCIFFISAPLLVQENPCAHLHLLRTPQKVNALLDHYINVKAPSRVAGDMDV